MGLFDDRNKVLDLIEEILNEKEERGEIKQIRLEPREVKTNRYYWEINGKLAGVKVKNFRRDLPFIVEVGYAPTENSCIGDLDTIELREKEKSNAEKCRVIKHVEEWTKQSVTEVINAFGKEGFTCNPKKVGEIFKFSLPTPKDSLSEGSWSNRAGEVDECELIFLRGRKYKEKECLRSLVFLREIEEKGLYRGEKLELLQKALEIGERLDKVKSEKEIEI
jgi:hypothetical protein